MQKSCKKKEQQHQNLVNMLTQYGYHVHFQPLPLGYAGTIYKTNLEALTGLGLSRPHALGVLRKLHLHAIKCLHSIIKERRYLETNAKYARYPRRQRSSTVPRMGQG